MKLGVPSVQVGVEPSTDAGGVQHTLASLLRALLNAAGVSASEDADEVVITLAALDAPRRLPDALEDVVDEELVRLVRGGGASSKGGGGVEQHDSGAPPGVSISSCGLAGLAMLFLFDGECFRDEGIFLKTVLAMKSKNLCA